MVESTYAFAENPHLVASIHLGSEEPPITPTPGGLTAFGIQRHLHFCAYNHTQIPIIKNLKKSVFKRYHIGIGHGGRSL